MKTIKGCWIWEGAQTGGLNYKDEDRYPAVCVCESKKSGGGFTWITRRFNLPLLEKRISAMNPRVLDSNAWILGFKNKTFGFGDTNTYAHTQNATADRSSHRGGT